MPNLNVNQQKAVDTTGENIIVSASAGTGKTTVLYKIDEELTELNHQK